jgi:hypothetical protein
MTPPGFTAMVAAFAILLSVAIRWLRSGATWGAIDEGMAKAEHLREATGILEFDRLQEVFGPPRLNDGVFPVTHREVMRQRTGLGYLLGDAWLDGGSAVIAIVALMPIWPLWGTRAWMDVLIVIASAYQALGWLAALTLMGKR